PARNAPAARYHRGAPVLRRGPRPGPASLRVRDRAIADSRAESGARSPRGRGGRARRIHLLERPLDLFQRSGRESGRVLRLRPFAIILLGALAAGVLGRSGAARRGMVPARLDRRLERLDLLPQKIRLLLVGIEADRLTQVIERLGGAVQMV